MNPHADSARSLIAVGRADEAVALLAKAIASRPDDAELRCLLAQAHITASRPTEALAAASAAAGMAPDDEWPHRLRSIALRQLRRFKEAETAAAEAVRLQPSLSAAHYALAEAHLAAGRPDAALVAATEMVRLDPGSAIGHDVIGRSLLRKKRYQEAEVEFRRALENDPNHAPSHNNLGVALQRQGRRREAINAYHSAARIDPSFAVARNNLYNGVRWAGGGIFGLFLLLRGLAAVGSRQANALVAVAVVLAFAALAYILWRRRRDTSFGKLPEPVVAFYRSESRRRRKSRWLAVLFRVGGFILIVGVLGGLSFLTNSGIFLLIALPLAVAWLYVSPSVWGRLVRRYATD